MAKSTLITVDVLSKKVNIKQSFILHRTPEFLYGILSEIVIEDRICYILNNFLNNEDILLATDNNLKLDNFQKVLYAPRNFLKLNKQKLKWLKHPYLNTESDFPLSEIFNYWDKFHIKQETENSKGLRNPQIGAIYATLAHWTFSKDKAIIVLPTGTGKTEVMLSLFVKNKINKLLVLVPSDALREQIGVKFLSLGLLKDPAFDLLPNHLHTPIVGIVKHVLQNKGEANTLIENSNIIVSTPDAINNLNPGLKLYFLKNMNALFVDEAHHSEAATWKEIINLFTNKPVIQFTATPFREDNKHLEGEIIYQYPLKLAQKEGYYQKINFKGFYEWDKEKEHEKLAKEGVKQLRKDLKNQKDHVLMARCYPQSQANEIFEIYKKYKEFNPVLIHSNVDNLKEKRELIISKKKNRPRIIVCVDMLGEGFDLPELKIGVFHYIRKSLTPTLQLVGRFTRTKFDKELGDATFIANLANQNTQKELDLLYKQDTDWNILISNLSENKSVEQKALWKFIDRYKNFPDDIPLQLLTPNLSTLLFKTPNLNVDLKKFENGLKHLGDFDEIKYDISSDSNSLIIVTGNRNPIDWGKISDIYDFTWDLHIIFWNNKRKVLSLTSTNTSSKYENFMKTIDKDARLISGEEIFRSFYNLNLIKLQKVGLRDVNGRMSTYRNRMGSDVEPTINAITQGGAQKVDIFGKGFEDGSPVTLGCSEKGRIWAFKDANLLELNEWIEKVTEKVLNNSIQPNDIFLKNICVSKLIAVRPNVVPISIDWNDNIYKYQWKERIEIYINGVKADFYNLEIELYKPSNRGDIGFQLNSIDNHNIQFSLVISNGDFKIKKLTNKEVIIKKGTKKLDLEEYLQEFPPIIRFFDNSELSQGNLITKLNLSSHNYDKSKFILWNWKNIDIKKEAQGVDKISNSIQHYVIEKLKNSKRFDIVFNDDGPGEVADVVGIKLKDTERKICVELYHCKYSQKKYAGGRIADVDILCGQAQKSIKYSKSPVDFFSKLLRRKPYTKSGKSLDRIEFGEQKQLEQIYEMSQGEYVTEFKIYIVQPGVSPTKVSRDQLSLFSSTENYLHETYQIPFGVIINDK